MPYIRPSDRDEILPAILNLSAEIVTVGELNYAITKLCTGFLPVNGSISYSDYNNIIGVLECAKLEFYRRAVATYEDKKIIENGDVYV